MKTAQDLHELLQTRQSETAKAVDTWLEDVVFPKFTHNSQGFEVPKGLSTDKVVDLLQERGFSVTSYAGHQGRFVYITIPPQGE